MAVMEIGKFIPEKYSLKNLFFFHFPSWLCSRALISRSGMTYL